MRIYRAIFFVLSILYLALSYPTLTHATWVPPQPPFSVEGNPPEDYFYGDVFALFRYIRPPALEIYENRERVRNYEDLEVCGGDGGPDNPYDHRDYQCDNIGDGCDGGDVELCKRGTTSVVKSGHSGSTSCPVKLNENNPPGTQGVCRYNQKPRINRDIKGTDFSNANSLVFPKIQSESNAYNYVGSDSNPITYGSQHLTLDLGEKVINQLMVVKRAKQTKSTLSQTGEWPLGWVDWGYVTPNGKTLLNIEAELPDGVSAAGTKIVEGDDDFFLNAGNLEAVSNTASAKEYVIRSVAQAASQNPAPVWVTDLLQAPLYSPSWRQGYVRPSICVWNICCPGLRCIVPPPTGVKRALYYDNSISQTFGAAMDEMLNSLSLTEGVAVYNKLAIKNPLIRFAQSAAPNAVPSKIVERLDKEIQDPCHKYVTGFDWLWFGTFMDYVNPGDYFDKEKKCPVYQIAPELSKQNARAFFESGVSALINMVWSIMQDDVDSVVYHLLTIPDAMGQSIQEIQQPVYDNRDTLAELSLVSDFNAELSNTVEDDEDYLYAGKTPFNPRRNISLYSCSDPMFSAQMKTSIEDYALGMRYGCKLDGVEATHTKCDPTKFSKIIADSPWQMPTQQAIDLVQKSAMFENGNLSPDLEAAYAEASAKTGVPCEVLAGIHFSEASAYFTDLGNPENRSNANGQPLEPGESLLDTSLITGKALLRHPINNTKNLIKSISNFNGGGNSNCQKGFLGGTIPYNNCPKLFDGEDDPYATNLLDNKHLSMYLLYCGDFTPCIPAKPYGGDRPGGFATALIMHKYFLARSPLYSPSPSATPVQHVSDTVLDQVGRYFTPKSCGEGSIATALGCLPYTTKAFVTTLLKFLAGISGAISLTTMLMATVKIMTGGGNPKQIQSGRELFIASIGGLFFVLFSVGILRLITSSVLKIPGF